jgi:LysR family transcriptional regulator, low CO2-responsive transcriptional regulator
MAMNVTMRHLRIFEAVAGHLSISRAAAELHLTQPAVSMQMKQLEELLGVALVEQVGRRMSLTDAGHELRIRARDIAVRMADLGAAMEQFRDVQRGVLRLAVVSTVNYFLPPLVAEFHRQFPGVRMILQVANREIVLAQLADNNTDLAITGRPPDSLDVVAQHFMDNPLVVIAAPSHPLAAESSISLQRLAAETLVVREPGSGTRAATERHFAEYGQVCRAGCELNTNEALKQAVRAGLGVGVVSAQTIELELQAGWLVVLPVENFPILRRWFVLHRTHKRLSAAALKFRQLLLALDPSAPVEDQMPPSARARRPRTLPA